MSLDALKRLCEAYPGGVAAVAQRLGKHPGTLRNELCPPLGGSAKLGWLDALSIMQMGRQVGLPQALAPLDLVEMDFGRMAVALPEAAEGVDAGFVERVAAVAQEFGRFMADVAASAVDGQISDNELKRATAECADLMGALQQLMALLASMNERCKPALRQAA